MKKVGLRDKLDPAETAKIAALFPVELRNLWPIRQGSNPQHV